MWHVLVALTLALSMSSSAKAIAANSQSDSKPAKSDLAPVSNSTNASKEINALLAALKHSVAERNSQLAASFWTENAIFIDETGEETLGRAALQQRFESVFQERQKKSNTTGQIEFEPERVIFPTENIALVVGVVSKQGSAGIAATRFSMTLEKQKEKWLIAQATETRITDGSAYEHLSELDWLIGNWKTTSAKGSAILNVEWAPGKSFIYITCVTNDKDSSLQTTDRQVIGWDERAGSIVSWFFGHRGNFAYGRWRHIDSNYLVDVVGTGSDGTEIKSTDIYSPKTAGQFLWKSVNRSNAGTSLPDTDNLTVEKVSGG